MSFPITVMVIYTIAIFHHLPATPCNFQMFHQISAYLSSIPGAPWLPSKPSGSWTLGEAAPRCCGAGGKSQKSQKLRHGALELAVGKPLHILNNGKTRGKWWFNGILYDFMGFTLWKTNIALERSTMLFMEKLTAFLWSRLQ